MNKTKTIAALLLILGFSSLSYAMKPMQCEWKSPNGDEYDFSSLYKKEGYQVKDTSNTLGMFDLVYITNVCEAVSCQGADVTVYEGLLILGELAGNQCDVLTNTNTQTYEYINNDNPSVGVQWNFQGDACVLPPQISFDESGALKTTPQESTETRITTFSVYCSEEQNSNWSVDTSNQCHLKFTMQSPYGCIGAASSGYTSFKILLFIIVLAALYFIGGSYINKRKYGLTGVESLPHHAFWTDFPYLINDGFKLTLLKTTSLIRYFKAKSGQPTSEETPGTYNTI